MPALRIAVGILLVASAKVFAQAAPPKGSDPVPTSRFVAVEPNVDLEVLDWGGTGRPMVMLAGLGNTAHVFDDLARQLRATYHVYGITRRGYGRSSAPNTGYTPDRLGDDVIAVLDSLRLAKPVLVGHSIAGEELSSVGSRHGDRVSALVYLDAIDAYAFYDTTSGDVRIDLNELRLKLDEFRNAPSKQLIDELLKKDLPLFEHDLRELSKFDQANSPLPPANLEPPDRSSFAAFAASRTRMVGFSPPVAELREQFEELPDGSVGRPLQTPESSRIVTQAILAGLQKYVKVTVPVLAIVAHPAPGNFANAAAKAAYIADDSTYRAKQAAVVRRSAPYARIVDVPGANHYVFITHEDVVVREINAFVGSLPGGRGR